MESSEVKHIGKFLEPDLVISQIEIENGSQVADFGCGPGYFAIPFGKAVGLRGHIYAFDILPQALETVQGKAKSAGLVNITTKRANLEKVGGSHLENEQLDWVIIKDILFQNQQKDIIISEAFRVLKSGGRVLVIEWIDKDSNVGPDQEIRISEEELCAMIEKQGFKIEKKLNSGDYHYAFIATKV